MHTLAILPLTNATASAELDWMREGLADMLVTDLGQSRYVRPVPGERVLRVLKDIGAEAQTRFDASALEAVSKRAPAETVLYGQFVQSGESVRLDLSLRRAGSGVTQPIKAEGKSSDVLALVDHISSAVKERLDLTPEQIRGDVARPFSEVATSSVDALRLYHEGAAALRAGSAQDAIAKLKDATTKDAGFAIAWARLAEAYADAGEQREAESAAERARALAEKAPLPLAQRYQIHAAVAVVKEDLETAAKSYGELAALYPGDPDVQYRLAATLRQLGQQPEAIAAYQKVLTALARLRRRRDRARRRDVAGGALGGRDPHAAGDARLGPLQGRRRGARHDPLDPGQRLPRHGAGRQGAREPAALARLPPQGGRQARTGGDAHEPGLAPRAVGRRPEGDRRREGGAHRSRARCATARASRSCSTTWA